MELKIEHISKQFKDKTAVDDVSLTLTTGVWGLLGANGAGKTTLMRILADIMTPSSGRISLDGKDIHKMGADYRNIFWLFATRFWLFPRFYGQRLSGICCCTKGCAAQRNHKENQLSVGYSYPF